MKLTLKIKLLPNDEQANLLLDTMKEANAVCNAISDADENAAKNIALLGTSVNSPEKPSVLYCQVHSFLGLKPIPSLCVGG